MARAGGGDVALLLPLRRRVSGVPVGTGVVAAGGAGWPSWSSPWRSLRCARWSRTGPGPRPRVAVRPATVRRAKAAGSRDAPRPRPGTVLASSRTSRTRRRAVRTHGSGSSRTFTLPLLYLFPAAAYRLLRHHSAVPRRLHGGVPRAQCEGDRQQRGHRRGDDSPPRARAAGRRAHRNHARRVRDPRHRARTAGVHHQQGPDLDRVRRDAAGQPEHLRARLHRDEDHRAPAAHPLQPAGAGHPCSSPPSAATRCATSWSTYG